MQIERYDGTEEERFYPTAKEMLKDVEEEAKNPNTKKLILNFPKKIIPTKRRKRRKKV